MSELDQMSTQSISTILEEKMQTFFDAAIKMDLPVALWRLPQTDKIHAICQLDNDQIDFSPLETAPAGFIFNPFQVTDEQTQHFIRADVSLDGEKDISLNPTYNKSQDKYDQLLQTMDQLSDNEKFNYSDYLNKAPQHSSKKEEFISLVEKSKQHIIEGYYQKIVPSRQELFGLKKDFHPVTELFKLCENYDNAFISLVYIPGVGVWLGASPELLISVKDQKYFQTISLAGTQEIPPNFNLAKAAWTQKEIEEQALVSRYIINCFKQIRLREYDEVGPKTVKAGNLMHLKTTYGVDMEAVNFPQLGSVMLDLLHPTSAVCGMPMIPAAKFLSENEPFDRQYFSGYLGPVNFDNDIHIFVNLRCARIYTDAGLIFAGAGVTEDSDAESEWNETKIKFQTLLNVIGQ